MCSENARNIVHKWIFVYRWKTQNRSTILACKVFAAVRYLKVGQKDLERPICRVLQQQECNDNWPKNPGAILVVAGSLGALLP